MTFVFNFLYILCKYFPAMCHASHLIYCQFPYNPVAAVYKLIYINTLHCQGYQHQLESANYLQTFFLFN